MENTTEEELTDRVAQFVKSKRIARGESQTQLAVRAFGDKTKQNWISRIENGRPIGLFTLAKLLEALDAKIEFIEL